jgi:hypothetical protein
MPLASPKTDLNIACIAPFQANAATSPNAAIIKAESFSIMSFFIFSHLLLIISS